MFCWVEWPHVILYMFWCLVILTTHLAKHSIASCYIRPSHKGFSGKDLFLDMGIRHQGILFATFWDPTPRKTGLWDEVGHFHIQHFRKNVGCMANGQRPAFWDPSAGSHYLQQCHEAWFLSIISFTTLDKACFFWMTASLAFLDSCFSKFGTCDCLCNGRIKVSSPVRLLSGSYALWIFLTWIM